MMYLQLSAEMKVYSKGCCSLEGGWITDGLPPPQGLLYLPVGGSQSSAQTSEDQMSFCIQTAEKNCIEDGEEQWETFINLTVGTFAKMTTLIQLKKEGKLEWLQRNENIYRVTEQMANKKDIHMMLYHCKWPIWRNCSFFVYQDIFQIKSQPLYSPSHYISTCIFIWGYWRLQK